MKTLKIRALRHAALPERAAASWRLVETLAGGAPAAILPSTAPHDMETAGAANAARARRRTRPQDRSFAAFLESFPRDGPLQPMSGPHGAPRERHVHPLLLRFWSEVGLGSFGNGCLHFFDPADHDDLLARLLRQTQSDPARVPFARSAAGDLFFWRDLRNQCAGSRAPETWDLAGDVAAVGIHGCALHRVSLTPRAFFATDLAAYLGVRR